jgi:hypothetical protein
VTDQDSSQDRLELAVAALAVCIARTLGKQNPTILQNFADEADRMHEHLCAQNRSEIGRFLVTFSLALAHPENFPLFVPPSDQSA